MNDKTHFINECEGILNSSDIYDRVLFKENFKKIYNKYNYNFLINNDLLSNILSKWKRKSLNFTKYSTFQKKYDYNNDLILREFLFINNSNEKKNPNNYEFIIWINTENLKRIRKNKHIFIDRTFHNPPDFK